MKTFEERYTAWIDGQLVGPALTAFEQEIARRSEAGEAAADRTDTLRLRHLLRDHFDAPELTNAEFFSHELRRRINAERASSAPRRPEGVGLRSGILSFFPWSVARLASVGAACLFVAGALYYGLEPRTAPDASPKFAQNGPAAPQAVGQPPAQGVESAPAPSAVPRDPSAPVQYAKNSPTPSPLFDVSPDIEVRGTDAASATALHYQRNNVNVLWTNGLDYLPEIPATPVPNAVPSPSVVP